MRFCPSCGRPAAGTPASIGERRQITVLFCDLVDSTALARRLDPEDLREILAAYQEIVGRIVGQLEGQIAQYLGDGVLVYFGYPHAHEDDALRAVSAALRIRNSLPALRDHVRTHVPSLTGKPICLRFGVHTGPVIVSPIGDRQRQEQLALGDTVNLAARLQTRAEPDEILISDTTYRLIGGAFVAEHVELEQLKGIEGSVAAWRILQETSSRERIESFSDVHLTPFVGRASELAGLEARWERACGHHGQALLLVGEAGIGKSRLLRALRAKITERTADANWIEFRGSALHQNSAFHAVAAFLEWLVDLRRDQPLAGQIPKIERALEEAGLPLRQTMPLVASLLSLSLPAEYPADRVGAEELRQRTLEWLISWVFAGAERGPIVVAVEDLHWIDVSTLEFLGALRQRVHTTSLLLVMTARPDFESPWCDVERMVLRPLRRTQAEAMIRHVAGDRALPDETVEEIVARTDGIPLFVEEITRTVTDGAIDTRRDSSLVAVPVTIQDSLMARIDRLGPARRVAQIASVLGREFSYELLAAVSSLDPGELERRLQLTIDAGLLQCRDPTRRRYAFKHALIRDVAYQALLRSTRRRYHARVATILETHMPEMIESAPEVVALHCEEGGMVDRAVAYYTAAGQAATRKSAHVEAIRHLRRAIELLKQLPPDPDLNRRELELQMGLGPPLIALYGYGDPEAERVLLRARELSGEINDGPLRLHATYGLSTYYQARADLRTSIELGEECLKMAEAIGDAGLRMLGHLRLGLSLYYRGQHFRALAHHQHAAALYDSQLHRPLAYTYGQDLGTLAAVYAAVALCALGEAQRAQASCEQALRLGEESQHPHTRAFVAAFAAAMFHMLREPEPAERLAASAVALGEERGFPLWVGFGRVVHGWARAALGRARLEAVEEIRSGIDLVTKIGTVVGRSYYLGILAETQVLTGDEDGALASLDEAIALAESSGITYWQPELLRLRAERLQECDPAEAITGFDRALEIARRQGARLHELRIATTSSRLLRRLGRAAEARDLLAPIYEEATAGGETVDLRQAKAELDALG